MTSQPSPPALATAPAASHWPQSLAFASIIFASAAVFGCAPLWLRDKLLATDEPSMLLLLGILFGGGVFVAAGLVHLLGDAAAALDVGGGYPLAMLWCGIGFFIPVCIDKLVSARMLSQRGSGAANGDDAPGHVAGKQVPRSVRLSVGSMASEALVQIHSRRASITSGPSGQAMVSSIASTDRHSGAQQSQSPAPRHAQDGQQSVSPVGTAVLFIALSVHSFIAGLVLGIDDDTIGVFVAIICHKVFAAWALGCSFARSPSVSPRASWMWVLGFALVTPVGILIGTGLASFTESTALDSFKAVAAGFFLYVGMIEIIAKEMEAPSSLVDASIKLVITLLGFGLMSMLALWV